MVGQKRSTRGKGKDEGGSVALNPDPMSGMKDEPTEGGRRPPLTHPSSFRLHPSNFMADAIHNAISILLKESGLSENEMHAAVLQVMDGNASAVGLGMLLTALRLKGETVDEIVGAARALRERAIRIPTQRPGLLDTC